MTDEKTISLIERLNASVEIHVYHAENKLGMSQDQIDTSNEIIDEAVKFLNDR